MTIINKEHFKAANKRSIELGGESRNSFKNAFKRLNNIKNYYNGQLFIGPDFVKDSFSFALMKDRKPVMNGGVILHGFEETFSVTLDTITYPQWRIHT